MKIVPLLFAFCMSCATAQPQVVLPDDSPLDYRAKGGQEGYFYFDGTLSGTGLVVAYWEARYLESEPTSLARAEPLKEMQLRFYPDLQTQRQLPAFQAPSGEAAPQRLFIYRDYEVNEPLDVVNSTFTEHDMTEISRIVEHFVEVPDNFLAHREGVIIQPAEVELADLLSFVEGDHRFLYARLESLTPLSITDYGLKQVVDIETGNFLGTPWVENFYLPGSVQVRKTPDGEGAVVAELPAGGLVQKLKTANEDWLLVAGENSEGKAIQGYVRKSELVIVN